MSTDQTDDREIRAVGYTLAVMVALAIAVNIDPGYFLTEWIGMFWAPVEGQSGLYPALMRTLPFFAGVAALYGIGHGLNKGSIFVAKVAYWIYSRFQRKGEGQQ